MWRFDRFEQCSKSLNYEQAYAMLNKKIAIDQRGHSV